MTLLKPHRLSCTNHANRQKHAPTMLLFDAIGAAAAGAMRLLSELSRQSVRASRLRSKDVTSLLHRYVLLGSVAVPRVLVMMALVLMLREGIWWLLSSWCGRHESSSCEEGPAAEPPPVAMQVLP